MDEASKPTNDLEAQVVELLRGGNKIEAIKLFREQMGVGLREAKEAVEALAKIHEIEMPKAGCAGMLLLAMGAAATAGWLWA